MDENRVGFVYMSPTATPDLSVRTTAGETFSDAETRALAKLVYKRFGNELSVATAAWRRMLQNSTDERGFEKLIA